MPRDHGSHPLAVLVVSSNADACLHLNASFLDARWWGGESQKREHRASILNTEPSKPPGDASYIYIITGEAMVTDLTTQIKRVNAGEVFHG
jgi:hypothetical protein